MDSELVQFPLRMRDWLKNVLLQLYEHDSTAAGFLTPKQRFRVMRGGVPDTLGSVRGADENVCRDLSRR